MCNNYSFYTAINVARKRLNVILHVRSLSCGTRVASFIVLSWLRMFTTQFHLPMNFYRDVFNVTLMKFYVYAFRYTMHCTKLSQIFTGLNFKSE